MAEESGRITERTSHHAAQLKATMKKEFQLGDILAEAARDNQNTITGVSQRKKADAHYAKAHAAGDKLDNL